MSKRYGLIIGSPEWVKVKEEEDVMEDIEEPKEGYGIKHATGTCCPDKTLHVICTGCDYDYGSLQLTIEEEVKKERERKITEDYGFYDLVEMAKTMLSMRYPREVFTGISGDKGPKFTAKLHEALDILKGETK